MLPLSLSLLVFPLLVAAQVDPLHVPLSRRNNARQGIEHYAAVAEGLRVKYGYETAANIAARHSRRQTSAAIPITNQNRDSSYFGTVSIGTPPQDFNVILDTGSADLWVADTSCANCETGAKLYDPSRSSTVQVASGAGAETQIRYGSGAVAGTISTETVSLGGFTVARQTFLSVDQTTANLLDQSVSGILGLAFSTIAATRSTPIWQALAESNQLSSPEMGFWLTRFRANPQAREEEPGGVFTLGGTNSSLFTGEIEFLDLAVNTPTFWLLKLSSLTVNGQSAPLSGNGLSAIDTGTTLIGGPTRDVTAFWRAVPGAAAIPDMAGFFSFPCNTNLEVTMSYGGKSWPINPIDMNLGRLAVGSPRCLGGIFDLSLGSSIVSGGGNPSWVVGDVFLKNVYSVYRSQPPSVGFAQLSDIAGGSGTPTDGPAGGNNNNSNDNGSWRTASLPMTLVLLLASMSCLYLL